MDHEWRELLQGRRRSLCVDRNGRPLPESPRPLALLPGSFNPLHPGHRRMLEVGRRLLRLPASGWAGPDYELSLSNVDKPALGRDDVLRRLRRFSPLDRIWLTRAARFEEKAELFPGVWFLLGADTLQRLASVRYYRSRGDRDASLRRLHRWRCRILAFGRVDLSGRFVTAADCALPAGWGDRCRQVSERDFRCDLSSTLLRAGVRDR